MKLIRYKSTGCPKGELYRMKVCVVGAGYVGLTTSAVLAELGHNVTCVDKDELKITNLNKGTVPIYEPGLQELLVKNKSQLTFTTNIKNAIRDSQIIFIAVGTPQLLDGRTDLSFIHSVVQDISKYIHSYKTIVTKSTVPPGTNRMIVKSLCELGVTRSLFQVVSNPEFLREGSAIYDMLHPDKTVIGLDENDKTSHEIMKQLYKGIDAPFIMTSLTGAEMIKYANNAFLATKISFINEMSRICDAYDVDIQSVAKGIGADPRIGPHFLQAGIGYGGSCFPKDLASLKNSALNRGVETNILHAVQEVNSTQIDVYVNKLKSVLPVLSSEKITVLGIAFKGNTDDTRCSQAVEIIKHLALTGCNVHTYDPKAVLPELGLPNIRQHQDIQSAIIDSDCVFIATDWSEFTLLDWKKVKDMMKGELIVDGRNCVDPDTVRAHGLTYIGVGRP
jgi:UDPglucose 6-dehydrogenase